MFKVLLACTALLAAAPLQAQEANPSKNVSFFVVGKTEKHLQQLDGKLQPAGYYFFTEIFLQPNGEVQTPVLTTPTGPVSEFVHTRSDAYQIKRRDFADRASLDKEFPDGAYKIGFNSPSGALQPTEVQVRLRPEDHDKYPAPIRIGYKQDGKDVKAAAVKHDRDLVIGWSKFAQGKADPKRIADDVMFVIVSDCDGKTVARTALPFESTPAYTYQDTSFRIPGDRLQPGSSYFVVLEHAELVDRVKNQEVIGLATFPAVTKGVFETAGSGGKKCPLS